MLHFDRLCVFTVHDRGREEGRKGGREEGWIRTGWSHLTIATATFPDHRRRSRKA
jgi:hypothetical protein